MKISKGKDQLSNLFSNIDEAGCNGDFSSPTLLMELSVAGYSSLLIHIWANKLNYGRKIWNFLQTHSSHIGPLVPQSYLIMYSSPKLKMF